MEVPFNIAYRWFCGFKPDDAIPDRSIETAIIERYRRRESSVEEALIEMYLAGVSVRRVEDITEALWGILLCLYIASSIKIVFCALVDINFSFCS